MVFTFLYYDILEKDICQNMHLNSFWYGYGWDQTELIQTAVIFVIYFVLISIALVIKRITGF